MRVLGITIEHWTAITNVALTLGLLLFAGMQWWVTHQAEQSRIRERNADEAAAAREAERASDRAFQIVWAEHFRLDGLADHWDDVDLVSLSAMGILRPTDLLPRDWSTIVSALGELSVEAGYLGGVALTLAHDAEREVATLNAVVDGFTRLYPKLSPAEIALMVRGNRSAEVQQLEASIRRRARDLSHVIWDASRHSPAADVDRSMQFRDDMMSELGRRAVAALQQRGSERPALPGRDVARGTAG